MLKDYRKWMPVKSEINNSDLRPRGCKEREIWICNVGENIGLEEDEKGNGFTRPVLILKVFSREFCHVVPLSTTDKRGEYYYLLRDKTGKTEKKSVALLSQSKPIDTARLSRKVGISSRDDFGVIREKIREILRL